MTVVLVHGNPETEAIWDLLSERLAARGRTDQVRLSPPGFGAPVPDGWTATVDEYRDWLVAELERIGEPVDLVGHDWGGSHVLNVAMSRPDLLHSWCSDVIGIYDPDYVWHDLAQVWQTPGEGEEEIEARLATPVEEFAQGLADRGMDPRVAQRVAPGFDAEMGRCILGLYRSAAQPVLRDLGARLPDAAARPGLALISTEDHFVGTDEQRRRAAARAGARVAVLDGLGHWWMAQDPDRGAAVLTEFWDSL
ncbi:alpha/beta fold hydrolase [Pseudonocardia alaniniphila]|uniref:Alpha/beta hydrolase n=1 Tax=Pseudonocardia alaniniphila TaxID=75291 RepID=A0ABS9TFT6_9PSEU|nr:alpha/beta hydrolase [Pseudonocardia alaniniphila]MCH6167399.1 alpha/beta hydrolase [Pseudonocardia alaniniphila]